MNTSAPAESVRFEPASPRVFNPWLIALDAFLIFAVVAVVLAFLVLLMKRSVAEKGAHLAAE
jgi:hypothetical protein